MVSKFQSVIIYLILSAVFINGLAAQSAASIEQMKEDISSSSLSEKRLTLSQKLLTVSQEENNIQGQFFALQFIGEYYALQNNYKKAITYYQQLFDLADANNDNKAKSQAYIGLGNTYVYLANYEIANNYYVQALKIIDKESDPIIYASIMNGLGIISDEVGKYREAIGYYQIAKKYDKKYSSSKKTLEENLWIIDNNIGYAYLSLGEIDSALYYFENNLLISIQNKDSLDYSMVYGNIALSYLKNKQYSKAIMYYDTAQYYANTLSQKTDLAEIYYSISAVYDSIGNSGKTLEYIKKADSLENVINNEEFNKQIIELTTKFDNTRLENENNKVLLARQRMWLIVISLSAGLFISLLVLRVQKQNALKKLKLQKLNEDLIKNELVVKELEAKEYENNLRIKELETIKLGVQLENKKADITNLAIDIVRKNEFSQELINRLEGLEKTKVENIKSKLRETIMFTSTHLQINEDLALLQTNIDEVNQAFFQKLDQQFENLSSNDKYILGLIRLGLSNKEIASIKGISPNSAKVLRYRLRKKLFLIPEVDFTTFLQKF